MAGENAELRALLSRAGLSNSALARAVVQAGATEGVHLATAPGSVRRLLDGAQPRTPVPRLVADVLSRRLGLRLSVADCGLTSVPDEANTFDGLHVSAIFDGTIATVVELSGRDLDRRNFMVGSALAVAAFAEPAWLAMTASHGGRVAKAGGMRLGMTDVEVLRATRRSRRGRPRHRTRVDRCGAVVVRADRGAGPGPAQAGAEGRGPSGRRADHRVPRLVLAQLP